jgi:AAA+ ATPase superfamily predicted ATPase
MDTPFRFGKIVNGQEFTDWVKEDHYLKKQWAAGNNSMIISPRRWGKSSLVLHAGTRAQRKNRETVFFFIDLYNIRAEQEYYEVYAKKVLKAAAGSLEEMAKSIRIFFSSVIAKTQLQSRPGHGYQHLF